MQLSTLKRRKRSKVFFFSCLFFSFCSWKKRKEWCCASGFPTGLESLFRGTPSVPPFSPSSFNPFAYPPSLPSPAAAAAAANLFSSPSPVQTNHSANHTSNQSNGQSIPLSIYFLDLLIKLERKFCCFFFSLSIFSLVCSQRVCFHMSFKLFQEKRIFCSLFSAKNKDHMQAI